MITAHGRLSRVRREKIIPVHDHQRIQNVSKISARFTAYVTYNIQVRVLTILAQVVKLCVQINEGEVEQHKCGSPMGKGDFWFIPVVLWIGVKPDSIWRRWHCCGSRVLGSSGRVRYHRCQRRDLRSSRRDVIITANKEGRVICM